MQKTGVSAWKKKMHLLVMIAERIRDAKFGNVHQPSFSIPGGREEGKRDAGHSPLPPKPRASTFGKVAVKSPSSSGAYVCVCVCESGGRGLVGVKRRERERESEETGDVHYDERVSSGEAEMNVCMLSVGLFKTEELDEYGTAAVGCCLRGRGFSTLKGRSYTGEGEGKQQEAGLMCSVLKYSRRHRTQAASFYNRLKQIYMKPRIKHYLFVLSEEETFYYPILFVFFFFRTGLLFTMILWKILC